MSQDHKLSNSVVPAAPGQLFVVATPIGCLADLTIRARDTLSRVAVILAEDTRVSAKLLQHYEIKTKLLSLNSHNEANLIGRCQELLDSGLDLALISDAGTPLISDPGQRLVSKLKSQSYSVTPIPGACAAIAALQACGLPVAKFYFTGFLPTKTVARQKALIEQQFKEACIICYEAPHRILATLADIATVYGPEQTVSFCRELTKKFETIITAPVARIIEIVKHDSCHQKGEIVLVIAPKAEASQTLTETQKALMQELLDKGLSCKDASQITAKYLEGSKRDLYNAYCNKA